MNRRRGMEMGGHGEIYGEGSKVTKVHTKGGLMTFTVIWRCCPCGAQVVITGLRNRADTISILHVLSSILFSF